MGPCRNTNFLIVYTVSGRTGEYALLLVAQMTNMNRDEPNASFKDNQTDRAIRFPRDVRLTNSACIDAGSSTEPSGLPPDGRAWPTPKGGPTVPTNLVGDGDRCASLGLREHRLADREIIGLAR